MISTHDTIVAVSTAAGPSPRGMVRLSGPDAFAIVGRLADGADVRGIATRHYAAAEARLRLRPGGPTVPATLYLMRAPRSYTRQDVAEAHTIGSPPLLRMLVDGCVAAGARVAAPGEFTRRAFASGRIDLAQAEAVLALIEATNAAEARAATRALRGEASRRIRQLHDRLVRLRALVEASLDFAQHDIELITPEAALGDIAEATAVVSDALRNADAGALPPEGVRVALCGLPNAGKSSLFNALLGQPRAIVTHIAGTTRDAVAEPLDIGGIRFRLYDTAGIAHAGDPVDAEAVARSRGLIAGTHVALVVLDATRPPGEAERKLWGAIRAPHKLLLLSKCDQPQAIADGDAAALAGGAPVLRTSAVTGEGLDALKAQLAALVRAGRVDASPADLTWNARHREAFRRAREALERARQAVVGGLGAEFVAADLRNAHDAIGGITGQVAPDDLLDVIFAQFCIGK